MRNAAKHVARLAIFAMVALLTATVPLRVYADEAAKTGAPLTVMSAETKQATTAVPASSATPAAPVTSATSPTPAAPATTASPDAPSSPAATPSPASPTSPVAPSSPSAPAATTTPASPATTVTTAQTPETAQPEISTQSEGDIELTPQATVTVNTGSSSMAKPTQAQIRARLLAITPSSTTRFATSPSIVSPFSPGTLPTATYSSGRDWINYFRYVAGLPNISLTTALNTNAAYGSMVQASTGTFSHTPPKPSGMSTTIYNQGYYACSTSNISYSSGVGIQMVIPRAIIGQVDDSGSNNLSTVGHRRWLFDPSTKTMGLGSANDSSGACYTNVRVFNNTYGLSSYYTSACGTVDDTGSVSYDCVAWPPSGNAPNTEISSITPWSITLNPAKYKTSSTDLANAYVTVKRVSDGKTWTLNKSDPAPSNTGEGFTVNTQLIGTGNAIIFSVGSNNLGTAKLTGSYVVTLNGIKTAAGAATALTYTTTFFDSTTALSNCTVSISPTSVTANGSAQKPTVSVSYGSTKLVEGVHYSVSYKSNVSPGTGHVVITGLSSGGVSGSVDKSFTINGISIASATVTGLSDKVATGSAITQTPVVKVGTTTLVSGTDYTVAYSNNVNPGTATVTFTGKGKYTGTLSKTFKITARPISSATATVASGGTYDGSAKTPTVSVTWSGTKLYSGTNYTVAYSNNVNAGTATATITGKGIYSGTLSKTFTIAKASLAASSPTPVATFPKYTYTGSAIAVAPSKVTLSGRELSLGTDYSITSRASNTNAGSASVTITGSGNYTGSKVLYCSISPAAISDAACSVGSSFPYTGSPVKPNPKVVFKSKSLVLNTDYTVSYPYDTTSVGTKQLTIYGKGNFSGSKQLSYSISALSIAGASATISSACTYNGSPQTPFVSVTLGSTVLRNNYDYSVTYTNNVNSGTATATVKGIGSYAGTISKQFTIAKANLAASNPVPVVEFPTYYYTGYAIAVAPSKVTLSGRTLVSGTDYTFKLSNNTNAGYAEVTLTGSGNYTGSKLVYCNIKPADISSASFFLGTNYAYTGNPVRPAPAIIFNKKTLVLYTDYRLMYPTDTTSSGVKQLTVLGKTNFTGSKLLTYTVDAPAGDVSKATVTIPSCTYTGSSQTPAATVKLGSTTLRGGTDYTVTYSNNVDAGTATATIVGRGSYVGRIVKSFSIAKINISTSSATPVAIWPEYSYTGSAIYVSPTSIVVRGLGLRLGTDYTVYSRSNNVNAGSAVFVIAGCGNFTGKATLYCPINPAKISSAIISMNSSYPYTGSPVKPEPYISYSNVKLVKGTDYTLTYPTNTTSQGTKTLMIHGKGNFTGTTTKGYTVASGTSITSALVTMPSCTYTGSYQAPVSAVRVGSTVLRPGTDYTVSYSNNVNVGTAKAVISGRGSYVGTLTKTFTIAPRSVTACLYGSIPVQKWTGSATKPVPTITYAGRTLALGTDFTLAYSNNVNVGTATVTVKGKGNYTGSKLLSYAISNQASRSITRLWGNTALDTMSSIVSKGWSSGCGGTVIIATNDGYWDALSASGLSGLAGNAPVLLTNGYRLSDQTRRQIARIRPKKIIVVGGTAAVSEGVKSAAASAAGTNPQTVRLSGSNARETSAAIALQGPSVTGGTWGNAAFFVTTDGYWDALSVGPAASALHMPIILVDEKGSFVINATIALQRNGIKQGYVVGGKAAVPDTVKDWMGWSGINFVSRLWGNTAVDTSLAVAAWEMDHGMQANGMGVATNDGYWDALTGAALCGKNRAPLLLVSDGNRSCTSYARKYKAQINASYVFGGKTAVSVGSYNALKSSLGM